MLPRSLTLGFSVSPRTCPSPKWYIRQASSIVSQPPTKTEPVEKKATSLFKELFPEESEQLQHAPSRRETTFEKLPPFQWNDPSPSIVRKVVRGIDLRSEFGPTGVEGTDSRLSSDHTPTDVLVIHRASKTLEETDFYRISPKGRHIEGWTSGIVKIIQARDETTLDPLGSYYIVFSSAQACHAYELAIRNLHALARIQTKATISGVHLHPPRHLSDSFEDYEASLQGFTLWPAHNGIFMYKLEKPFDRQVARLIQDGVPAVLAPLKQNAGKMVLLIAEEGGVDLLELREALKYDGKRRNMDWRLTGSHRGITKITGSNIRYDFVEDHAPSRKEDKPLLRKMDFGHPTPSRFVMTFEDRAEARRFVREWHRRRLPSIAVLYPGDDEPPMMSAELIW